MGGLPKKNVSWKLLSASISTGHLIPQRVLWEGMVMELKVGLHHGCFNSDHKNSRVVKLVKKIHHGKIQKGDGVRGWVSPMMFH